jgi:hypothetical protein
VTLLLEFGSGVLRVVNQDIGALHQLDDAVGDGVEIEGGLVIAYVGDHRSVPIDAVTDGWTDMGHRSDSDGRITDVYFVL